LNVVDLEQGQMMCWISDTVFVPHK